VKLGGEIRLSMVNNGQVGNKNKRKREEIQFKKQGMKITAFWTNRRRRQKGMREYQEAWHKVKGSTGRVHVDSAHSLKGALLLFLKRRWEKETLNKGGEQGEAAPFS